MSSEDHLASVSKGVTEGIINWTEEKAKGLVKKFRNRELAFIEDPETINLAKKQRRTSEWELFKRYVDAYHLRVIFSLGLTLRTLEKRGKPVDKLRRNIQMKYGSKGLHIAYFVQNGFFGRLLGNILEREQTPDKLSKAILNMFTNIENTVVFVSSRDTKEDLEKKAKQIIIKINSHNPKTFIISSIGRATGKCSKVRKMVMKNISGYTLELNKAEKREICFLNKSEQLTI